MRRRIALATLAVAGFSACVAPTPPPAQVTVSLLGGNAASAPLEPSRVAVVLDAGASMAQLSEFGPSHWIGARRGAERLIGSLPPETRVDLFLVGGDRSSGCEALVPGLVGADAVATQLARATPSGRAPLVATLEQLAASLDEDTGLSRAVVFTNLSDECGGDLCAVAQHLAARDVRLDLVVIGDATPPECLAAVSYRDLASAPSGWASERSVPFHVNSPSLAPGMHLCGESSAHPLPVPAGLASVMVQLDPPLRVERRFAPGSRWQLEVLDFPQLDPPVREWRWQELPPEPRSRR